MATIKEITAMCKAGKLAEAFQLAKEDYRNAPDNVWTQRSMGWVCYYILKEKVELGNYTKMLACIDDLLTLEMLNVQNDAMIFDNAQFQIALYIKKHISVNNIGDYYKLSDIYTRLKVHNFGPSLGHSFLLQEYIKFEKWFELLSFIDWWNLDNLRQEDYVPFINAKGQKCMTLAERVYIAYSKALLKKNDLGKIEEFLPKLEELIEAHPEMLYPGYFCGKLLLALGSNDDEALKVVMPFAQKKSTEFWVWQLLSDVFKDDSEKQLACLLRAVHCKTQESFLGKVRIKLASLYIQNEKYNSAKFHINAITRCYLSNGWKLPLEVEEWIQQPWIQSATSSDNDSCDYMRITNEILYEGAKQAIAVATYIDQNTHRVSLIYGLKQRAIQKLRIKVAPGTVFKINFINESNGKIKVLYAEKTNLKSDLSYIRYVEGTVSKKPDKQFAFLHVNEDSFFISPIVVDKYNVKNGIHAKGLLVYDYDKKKEFWNWVCIKIDEEK